MYSLIIGLVILASVLMCVIVLIQESKGGGLASGFSSSNQIMGVRKTTDFLEKATWGLSIAMVVLSIISVAFLPDSSQADGALIENTLPMQNSTDANNMQSFPASAGQQPAK